jgi:hypothetical protein
VLVDFKGASSLTFQYEAGQRPPAFRGPGLPENGEMGGDDAAGMEPVLLGFAAVGVVGPEGSHCSDNADDSACVLASVTPEDSTEGATVGQATGGAAGGTAGGSKREATGVSTGGAVGGAAGSTAEGSRPGTAVAAQRGADEDRWGAGCGLARALEGTYPVSLLKVCVSKCT